MYGIPNPLYCEDKCPDKQMGTPAKYIINQWSTRLAMIVSTPITLINNTQDMEVAPNQAHSEGLINNEKNIAREPKAALSEPARYFIYRYMNNVRAADYLVTQTMRHHLKVNNLAKRKASVARVTGDSRAMQDEDETDMPFVKRPKTVDATVSKELYSAIKTERQLGREGAVAKLNRSKIYQRMCLFLDDSRWTSLPTFNSWINLEYRISADSAEKIRKAARAFISDVEEYQTKIVCASTMNEAADPGMHTDA